MTIVNYRSNAPMIVDSNETEAVKYSDDARDKVLSTAGSLASALGTV